MQIFCAIFLHFVLWCCTSIAARPGTVEAGTHPPAHVHAYAYTRPQLPIPTSPRACDFARDLARATSERLARANFSRACDLARESRIPLARAKKKPGLMSGPLSRVSVARVNSRACQIIRNTAVYVDRNATISSQKFQVRSPVIRQQIVQNTRYAGRIHQSPGELKTM